MGRCIGLATVGWHHIQVTTVPFEKTVLSHIVAAALVVGTEPQSNMSSPCADQSNMYGSDQQESNRSRRPVSHGCPQRKAGSNQHQSFAKMPNGHAQTVYKGRISLGDDTVNFIRISPNVEAKVSSGSRVHAQLAFVDNSDTAVPVPPNISCVFQSDQSPAARLGDIFLISWDENYLVRANGVELFSLESQKQLAICGDAALETRAVQV